MSQARALRLVFIEVTDGASLREFYGKTLGLDVLKEFGPAWTEYGGNSGAHIAIHELEDEVAGTSLFLSFEVDDVGKLRARLVASGVACSEVRQRDRGNYFTTEDPAGTRLHFIQFDAGWRERMSY